MLAVLRVGVAIGLIYLRTDTNQAGNRLHGLFRQKRDLEKECCRLELAIARLKNQERLRAQAAVLREDAGETGAGGEWVPPSHGTARPRPEKSPPRRRRRRVGSAPA